MREILFAPLPEISQRIGKAFSSEELVRFFLSRVASLSRLNAFITVSEEEALKAARAADSRLARGETSPLLGLPVALKDNIVTRGIRTTCASRILEGYVPPYDATVVERLKKEGAVIIGKTNMDEFAMGSSTENSYFGAVKNPWDETRTPGGSSGGSAAAVAAGMVPVALGSDTGGSIRQPAAFTGITGLKPTYGLVSRYGLVAFASSLDQIGPIARSASDCYLLFQVIRGHDPKDSTSIKVFPEPEKRGLKGVSIGIPKEYFSEGLSPAVGEKVMEAVKVMEKAGARPKEISLPHTRFALPAYYIIAPAETSSNLARYDGMKYGLGCTGLSLAETYEEVRARGFLPEVKRRIMLGTFALSSGYHEEFYGKAQKARTLVRHDFEEAFRNVDLIVGPTTPTVPFRLGEKIEDPLAMYLSDIYTIPPSLAGIPSLALPCGMSEEGLPMGFQITGPRFSDTFVLSAGEAFQKETDWHLRYPPL